MYNHGFTDYLVNGESVCKQGGIGISIGRKKRWQVPCVVGMWAILGVIVGLRVCKWVAIGAAAAFALMYMKTEYWA